MDLIQKISGYFVSKSNPVPAGTLPADQKAQGAFAFFISQGMSSSSKKFHFAVAGLLLLTLGTAVYMLWNRRKTQAVKSQPLFLTIDNVKVPVSRLVPNQQTKMTHDLKESLLKIVEKDNGCQAVLKSEVTTKLVERIQKEKNPDLNGVLTMLRAGNQALQSTKESVLKKNEKKEQGWEKTDNGMIVLEKLIVPRKLLIEALEEEIRQNSESESRGPSSPVVIPSQQLSDVEQTAMNLAQLAQHGFGSENEAIFKITLRSLQSELLHALIPIFQQEANKDRSYTIPQKIITYIKQELQSRTPQNQNVARDKIFTVWDSENGQFQEDVSKIPLKRISDILLQAMRDLQNDQQQVSEEQQAQALCQIQVILNERTLKDVEGLRDFIKFDLTSLNPATADYKLRQGLTSHVKEVLQRKSKDNQ